jgi:hypothetical protein
MMRTLARHASHFAAGVRVIEESRRTRRSETGPEGGGRRRKQLADNFFDPVHRAPFFPSWLRGEANNSRH